MGAARAVYPLQCVPAPCAMVAPALRLSEAKVWGCGFANQLPAEIFLFPSILACPILGASRARCAPNGELIFFGFPAALHVQQPLESPASPELTQEKCRVRKALSSHSSQCCHALSPSRAWCSEDVEGALSGASLALGVP